MVNLKEKKCAVVREDVNPGTFDKIEREQKNATRPNDRGGEERAFQKALRGSKTFLKSRDLF